MKKTNATISPRAGFEQKLHGYSTLSTAALATAGAVALGATASAQSTIVNITFGGTPPSASVASLGAGVPGNHYAVFSGLIGLGDKVSGVGFQYHQNAGRASGTAQLDNVGANPHQVQFGELLTRSSRSIKNFAPGPAHPIAATTWNGTGMAFRTFSSLGAIGQNRQGQFKPTAAGTAGRFTGYAGFRIHVGVNNYYGWLHLSVGEDANGRPNYLAITPGPNTGIAGAYNSAVNTGIYAGQINAIPEPASVATGLALFALGAAGVREHRRRRAAAAA